MYNMWKAYATLSLHRMKLIIHDMCGVQNLLRNSVRKLRALIVQNRSVEWKLIASRLASGLNHHTLRLSVYNTLFESVKEFVQKTA